MKWFVVTFIKAMGLIGGVAAFLFVLDAILQAARALVKGG